MEQAYHIRTRVLMAIRVGLARSPDDRTFRHDFHRFGYELFGAIHCFKGGGEEYLHRENKGTQGDNIWKELGKYERHGRSVEVFRSTYNADQVLTCTLTTTYTLNLCFLIVHNCLNLP